jgi:Concanavalin A-like lectin/glucanases superfamily
MKRMCLLPLLVGCVVWGSSTCQADVTLGLVGYYALDGNANDSSGNNYDGTAFNGITYSPHLSGLAANFSGDSQYISLPNSLPVTSSFTVAFGLKTGMTAPGDFPFGTIFLISRDIAGADYDWNICLSEGRKLAFHTGTPTNDSIILSTVSDLPSNEWVHVTCVADTGAGLKNIYLNGLLAASTSWVPTTFDDAGVSPYLGNDTSGTELHPYFNGSMDEVRFYNRALSASEVLAIASGEPTAPANWLYAQFHLTATVQEPISQTLPRTFRKKIVTINNAKILELLGAATSSDFTGANLVIDRFGMGFSVIKGTNVLADVSSLLSRSGVGDIFVLTGTQTSDSTFNLLRNAVLEYQFMPNNADHSFSFRAHERDKIWTSTNTNSTPNYFEEAHSDGFGPGFWNGRAAVFDGTIDLSTTPPKPATTKR